MTAIRRIQRELAQLEASPIVGVSVTPDESNLFNWAGTIKPSSESPYKGGTYKFTLVFPENFPFKAPNVKFTTKIYHPGINEQGEICVTLLKDDWKPSISVVTILNTIAEKINNPSPDDPFEPEIAQQLKEDKPKFLQTAKEWVKKYAS
ncbi:UBC-like protein [Exidia glandulosa HHB12029]|uniref:E2 ubiquitin-conjugating enzyme n=1 Tax=Exidia glandulosa HHB12029 TaxID=1314781 RepID=A0A165DQF8_EXIGL|nr:UBC-like protein [Exidia glandulosa HHB12029]